MEDLIIKSTRFTPEINFRYNENRLDITGESYPENTSEFYGPIFESLTVYLNQLENQEVNVSIRLKYFNSSSSKILINLFDLLEEYAEKGKNITVDWIHKEGDDDSREFGEEFAEDLNILKFNIISGTF
jgi:plasmid replication initiation protein